MSGETSIRHENGEWRFESVLRIRGERPALQHNRYEIEPFSQGARSTHWIALNPAIGALLDEDKLISSWALELSLA